MQRNRRLGYGGLVLVLVVGMLAAPGAGQEPTPALTGPEKVVQDQVEAYNRHDIEAFLKTYAPEIKLYTFPDKETATGLESLRTTYGKLFADEPTLKVKIARRIVQGEYVIDQEEVSMGRREFKAVAIYRVKGDKITEVRFMR